MKLTADKDDLKEAIKGADLAAKRKAFRKHLPYAILRNGNVILVYPDKHIEIATPERLKNYISHRYKCLPNFVYSRAPTALVKLPFSIILEKMALYILLIYYLKP